MVSFFTMRGPGLSLARGDLWPRGRGGLRRKKRGTGNTEVTEGGTQRSQRRGRDRRKKEADGPCRDGVQRFSTPTQGGRPQEEASGLSYRGVRNGSRLPVRRGSNYGERGAKWGEQFGGGIRIMEWNKLRIALDPGESMFARHTLMQLATKLAIGLG